jgi:predicted anti-sigma-YlaC factor YlaD
VIWHPSESDLALAATGDLAAWRDLLVRRHLRGCAECRQLAGEYAALPRALRELAGDAPATPAWLGARILAGAPAAPAFAGAARALRQNPAVAFAAMVVLFLLGLLLLGRDSSMPPQNYKASATADAVIGESIGPRGRERMVVYAGTPAGPAVVSGGDLQVEISQVDPRTGAITITRIRMGD